jgi:peptidoglycan hydrolase-like protein with peptidoglycan-binding domain
MTKKTTRIAAFAAALMFGAATLVPMTASAQNSGTTTSPSSSAPAAAPPAASAPAAPMKKMGMHRGMHMHHGSQSVSAAQDALNKEGANLTVDGKYGPKTRAAVKSYQQAHGLKATGHLDKTTRAALKIS